MKVVIAPSVGESNPYQKLLVTSLTEAGVTVSVPQGFFSLWKAVLERPDVVHLQWQHSYFRSKRLLAGMLRTLLFFAQWLTLRLMGVRFVWTVHNIVNHEKYHVWWELGACRLLARLVETLIVHGQAAIPPVAEAYRISPDKIKVVPHGHYINWYPPAPNQAEARQQLGLSAKSRIFLYFGQVRSYKGLARLLTEFASLKEENVQLILAGKPKPASLGETLLAQAASDKRVVTEFRFIEDERLTAYLSACDLVVLPYRDSLTSGGAVLAASCNRPVLVPNLGCMKELPPETAILYDPEQPDGLQLALEQALRAPLDKMGQAARAYIEQFPWSLVGTGTAAIYRAARSQAHLSDPEPAASKLSRKMVR